MQKAANNRVEVYVKIGLCTTSIDFESFKHNYHVICSATDATFGSGPGGDFLTVMGFQFIRTQTGDTANPGAEHAHFTEAALRKISQVEKAKIIHSTTTDTAIPTF